MDFQELTLNHKDLLYERLKSVDTLISEYCFPNLYLFRKKHHYAVFEFKGEIYIKGTTIDNTNYIMPTRDINLININDLIGFKDFNVIFPVDEKWLNCFKGPEMTAVYNDADSDYIYTVEKMCTYQGRKLHKKRNLLKQFISNYSYDILPLVNKEIDNAKEILDSWLNDSDIKREESDYDACLEALYLSDELHICGVIYYVEDEPAGFIIGEDLNDETFAVHFAKGKKKYKGIYQFMYNNFANKLPHKYKYLNFEQDLGISALKLAKSSYIPDFLLKKYRILIY